MLPVAQKRQRDVCKDGGPPGQDSDGAKQRKLTATNSSIAAARSADAIAGGKAGHEAAQGHPVVLIDRSVRANGARRKIAQECAQAKGSFSVSQAHSPEQCPLTGPPVTHVVLGPSLLATSGARQATRQRLQPLLARWPGLVLLNEAWLTQLTSKRFLPETNGYELKLDQGPAVTEGRGQEKSAGLAVAPRAPPSEGKYERWLGRWSRELDDLDEVGILLQATYNDQRCARVGNAAIVTGLRELKQYELAIRESEDTVGARALAYARAAAAVQGCAFRITGDMPDAFLVQHLPFVNSSCARIILQLAQSSEGLADSVAGSSGGGSGGRSYGASGTSSPGGSSSSNSRSGWGSPGPHSREALPGSHSGPGAAAGLVQVGGRGATCDRLELFRRDLPVRDSDGALRPASAGAASRRRLTKLHGVGPSTAKLWYDKGCRSLDDALRMVRSGQLQPPSAAVAWALEHHEHLTADVGPAEVGEMTAAVEAALAAATPLASGWAVQVVGGGRRGRASHDVDLMVSHPDVWDQGDMADHVEACVEWLVRAGHLLPTEGNCSRKHITRMDDFRKQLPKALSGTAEEPPGKLRARSISDGLHYLFGVFRTRGGQLRRLDLIFACWPWRPHAVLGWSGSTQFLRLLNQHAAQRGLRRTNHGLYSLATRQPVAGIRDEAGIFEALGLPYREPQDRQCP